MITQSHDPATCHCDNCRVEQALIGTGGWEWVDDWKWIDDWELVDDGRPAQTPPPAGRHWVWYLIDAIILGWVVVLLWLAFGV